MSGPPIAKKRLAMVLSGLPDHPRPKTRFEQVRTPGDIAAKLLEHGWACGDIEDRFIIDLGCGTGILSLGAALLGAEHVTGYDIDAEAIAHGRQAIDDTVEAAPITFHEADVRSLAASTVIDDLRRDHATYLESHDVVFEDDDLPALPDTVVMNPPFGADLVSRSRGGDRVFLALAFQLADVVLSMHPRVTEGFLSAFARDAGFMATKMENVRWALPARFAHHQKETHTIEVGLYRFVRDGSERA